MTAAHNRLKDAYRKLEARVVELETLVKELEQQLEKEADDE